MAKTDFGPPDYRQMIPPIVRDNYGKWKHHTIPRPGVLQHVSESGAVLTSVRVASPRLVSTDFVRDICDIADRHCGGYVRFTTRHNVEFLVSDQSKLDPLLAELDAGDYMIGGIGAAISNVVHTQGWIHCKSAVTDASGLVKSMMDELHGYFTGKLPVPAKLRIAVAMEKHDTVGIDIVNHCINDILAQGARPLFFMDYFATSKLDPDQTAEVVTGIAEACKESGMALLGGETAEMPGVYQPNEFDVAGTILGVIERDDILPRKNLQAGDVLIGLASSGPHTNGYSLIRKIFADTPLETFYLELNSTLADALLAPHRSYFNALHPHLDKVKALAHLTGGGFIENIPRVLPENLSAEIHLGSWPVPPLWNLIQQKGNVSTDEMYRVFNMGIGMVVIVDKSYAREIQDRISEPTFIIGELIQGGQKVLLVK